MTDIKESVLWREILNAVSDLHSRCCHCYFKKLTSLIFPSHDATKKCGLQISHVSIQAIICKGKKTGRGTDNITALTLSSFHNIVSFPFRIVCVSMKSVHSPVYPQF